MCVSGGGQVSVAVLLGTPSLHFPASCQLQGLSSQLVFSITWTPGILHLRNRGEVVRSWEIWGIGFHKLILPLSMLVMCRRR